MRLVGGGAMTTLRPSGEAADRIGDGSCSSVEVPRALPVREGEKVLEDNLLRSFQSLIKTACSAASLKIEDIVDAFCMDLSIFGTLNGHVRDVLYELSNCAFNALDRQFEQILSTQNFLPATSEASAQSRMYHCDPSSLRNFCFHLRCCTTLLYMLEFDLNLMVEKSQTLVKMLGQLCCPDVCTRVCINSSNSHGSIYEDMNPIVPAVLLILEVFTDELLVHQNTRKHFAALYHISCACDDDSHLENDAVTYFIGIILELLCSHFLLSTHTKDSFNRILQSMFWARETEEERESGQTLSLTAALALLGMTAIISAPLMLQSHIILLVSKCIVISGEQNLDCYLGTLEQSVILYTSHFQKVKKDFSLGFDFCVRKSTGDAVSSHIKKWFESDDDGLFLHGTKAGIVSSCTGYVAGNRHIMAEPWREEACLILNSILQRIEESQTPVEDNPVVIDGQEVYFVATLLKLMGSSLLKIVTILREAGEERSDGGEREFISSILDCFENCSVGQYVLCEPSKSCSSSSEHKILAHLASLLFCSVERRFFPIWEGCIFVMMAVMNLLVLKEGNLDMPRAIFGHHLSIARIPVALAPRQSSLTIASNLQKLQGLYLKEVVNCLPDKPSSEAAEDTMLAETAGSTTCNGAAFLRCVVKGELPDWDDLADFIEAKPGKDYSQWLLRKKRYGQWKHRKSMAISRERKLALWKKLGR